jgi:hypothetical protein
VRKSQDKVNRIKVKVDLFSPNSKSDSYILNILTLLITFVADLADDDDSTAPKFLVSLF